MAHLPCSLVSTVLNDLAGAQHLVDDLRAQTRFPDEFVIVDGGSTDGTFEYLRDVAPSLPFDLRVIWEKGANVSRGRNHAIDEATHEVLLTTDFGCRLDARWVEKLMEPFEADPEVEIVTGTWKIRREDVRTPAQYAEWSLNGGKMELIATETCLASTRSLAFKKQVWKDFGRYPEDLTLAGDDAIFSMWMVQAKRTIAAAPEAICYWHRFPKLRSYWREARRNFRGAGEAIFFLNFGVRTGFLWLLEMGSLLLLVIGLTAWAITGDWRWAAGSALFAGLVWAKRFLRWLRALKHLAAAGRLGYFPWVVMLDVSTRTKGVIGFWHGYFHGKNHCQECRARMKALNINRW